MKRALVGKVGPSTGCIVQFISRVGEKGKWQVETYLESSQGVDGMRLLDVAVGDEQLGGCDGGLAVGVGEDGLELGHDEGGLVVVEAGAEDVAGVVGDGLFEGAEASAGESVGAFGERGC